MINIDSIIVTVSKSKANLCSERVDCFDIDHSTAVVKQKDQICEIVFTLKYSPISTDLGTLSVDTSLKLFEILRS